MNINVFKIASIIALWLFGISSFAQNLAIVKDNKSDYVIIVSKSASQSDITAAEYLQEYIFKSTGVVVPSLKETEQHNQNVISIGNTLLLSKTKNKTKESYQEDEFQIFADGNNLFFVGGTDKGTIYGVIEFIEKYLNSYVLAPDVEIVAELNEILIPENINLNDKPYNVFRNINGSFVDNEKYKNWMRLDNVYEVFGNNYYVHTFNNLIPWEKYYKLYPDLYAYYNDKHFPTQLCLSNPEVLNRAITKLKHEMFKQPDRKYWSVSQNDNDSYCKCEKCTRTIEKEGSPSGLLLQFVNKIAAEFPDKVISTLAYSYTRKAPKYTKPAKNVQIVLCTIELNRSMPIAEDPSSASFVEDIKQWSALTDNIMIWDYTVDFAHFSYPFPNLHVLQPNIKFFNEYNVKSHFQQTNTLIGHEMSELKSYLISRLLWNPDINFDSTKQVFIEKYFGDASKYILEYVNTLEKELLKSGDKLNIYEHPTSHENTIYSEKNLKYYNKLFDKAEKAVKNNPYIYQRVKVARLPIQYTVMEIGKKHLLGKRGWYNKKNKDYIIKEEMLAVLDDFYNTCKNNNVRNLNESRLTPKKYYDMTMRFLRIYTKDNLAFEKKLTSTVAASAKYSKGDVQLLTNGVRGSNDYNVHWIGWENEDTKLILDLEKNVSFDSITISSMYYPQSWILHPQSIECLVSEDGINYISVGKYTPGLIQKEEENIKDFVFTGKFNNIKYVSFDVKGTKIMPDWHYAAGGKSWFFFDEIIIK